jgi:Flp pilus assembly protein TadG
MRRRASLLHSTEAVTALEFGMLAPIIVGLLVVSLGFGRLILMNTLIYDAALEASRYGSTGNGGSSRLANITAVVTAITGVNGTVTMTPYPGWTSLASNSPTASDAAGPPGEPGEVVVYTVSYKDALAGTLLGFIPMFRGGAITNNPYLLSQTLIVQNEPNFSTN